MLFLLSAFLIYNRSAGANQKVVVINPGHSIGYDSGASSAFKSEAQVNQEVAGRVVRILNQRGYKVYITHTTDTELQGQKLLSNADGSSLKNVGAAVNAIHPDLALSIHHNSGGASSSGYEIYWSSYRDFDQEGVYSAPGLWSGGGSAYRDSSPCGVASGSYIFSECIRKCMEGIPNLNYRYTVERDDYLPAHADATCCLYEGGYLSNPTEAAYLASDAYQNEAATRLCNAIDMYLGGSGAEADNQPPSINSVYTSTTETSALDYTVECNVSDNVGIGSVKFVTWTDNNGQDDIIWAEGVNNGNGNYSSVVSAKDHNFETGVYITHIYAYDLAGNFIGVVTPQVTLKPVDDLQTGLNVSKLTSDLAVVYANNLGSNGYNFAVWSDQNGQDDLIWTQGEPQLGSCYRTIINRADHHNDTGKYIVHCYTLDNRFVGANEIDFGEIEYSDLKADIIGSTLNASVNIIDTPDPIKDVLFAVWSEENGQDDLVWYPGTGNGNNWRITQDLSKHPGSGLLNVHVYVVDIYGNPQLVDGVKLNHGSSNSITPENTDSISVNVSPIQGNTFTVEVNNVPSGYNVLIPTWSEENGQDDLHWYAASNVGNGKFSLTVNVNNHTGSGLYNIHVYLQDSSENLQGVTSTTIDVPASAHKEVIDVNTPIMGQSSVTANDLANMYTKHSPSAFPDYYIARGVSLAQFAQMYVEEGAAENVRADIAFSQAMEETGFLNFGGDVSISQFNFAGLGATGNGVAGENFAAKYGDDANGIRMGIRAQIQHLKAYASTDPLNQECVDARFNYITRGKATTINGLSGTWAADTGYAPKIVAICNYI